MKLPVIKAFVAGFALFFGHAGELLKALWLPALLMMIALAYLMPPYLEATLRLPELHQSADPQQVLAQMGPLFKYAGLLYLVMAIVYPMMAAGNLKYIIRGQTLRLPFYLQFGLDEFRLLLTVILLVIMLGLAYLTGMIAFLVLSTLAMLGGQAIGGVIASLAMVAFMVAMIWFLLRMSMSLPAAIGARKVGIAESWRVTAGNVWRLFFYWLLWFIAFLVLASVYFALAAPDLLALMKQAVAVSGQDSAAAQEIQIRIAQMQRGLWDTSTPGFWRYIIATYVYTLVYTALWNIAGGVAYRYLSGEQSSA